MYLYKVNVLCAKRLTQLLGPPAVGKVRKIAPYATTIEILGSLVAIVPRDMATGWSMQVHKLDSLADPTHRLRQGVGVAVKFVRCGVFWYRGFACSTGCASTGCKGGFHALCCLVEMVCRIAFRSESISASRICD